MVHIASPDRYDISTPRRVGRSGLQLPPVSLGLWHNFGGLHTLDNQRDILRRAFDLGVFHFDLANNYGPPPGSAEENFGHHLARDFTPYRDELIISTKAGYRMWPGPHGEWGSRKNLLASLDASLGRMGIDYVDIFYSHRFDPDTPLEETMGALHTAVQQGKALYVGVSSYTSEQTRRAAEILTDLGTPLVIHQPVYNMLNRWIEDDLLDTLDQLGMGSIAFSPLAQGQLTNRYLQGIPEDSRAARVEGLERQITPERIAVLRSLNRLAQDRGQSLAQLAITWLLRGDRVTSALIGASSVAQLEDSLGAATAAALTADEERHIEEILAGA